VCLHLIDRRSIVKCGCQILHLHHKSIFCLCPSRLALLTLALSANLP
jgi:hypothetical protein